MLLDWLAKLKRSITNVLLIGDMEYYFMYPSMCCQSNIYNIVEEPGRMYLPGTLELLTFIIKLLVFMGQTFANEKSFRSSRDSVLRSYVYTLMIVFACDI